MDQQLDLDAIDAVIRNAAQLGADIDPGTAAALVAEVRRLRDQNRGYGELAARRESELIALRARLVAEERAHGETIDDRERFHEMADKLAYAVAPEEVIGEHSSMNCPWENALDLITPMAEVEKLREELERQTALAEQGARANRELSRLRAELAEAREELTAAVQVSGALNQRLAEEQLAGSALYAALTMPTTPEQRQAALDKFTAVAQQVSTPAARSAAV